MLPVGRPTGVTCFAKQATAAAVHTQAATSSDAELQRLTSGESAWLTDLFRQRPRLIAYLRRTSPDPDELSDLVAETLALMWCDHRTPSEVPLDESLMLLCARRVCAKWKAAHRREVELANYEVTCHEVAEAVNPLDDPEFDPGIVQSWLLVLPPQQRAAVVFRKFRGGSFSHVARCLGCSASAAKTHYQRGLDALRRQAQAWVAEQDGL